MQYNKLYISTDYYCSVLLKEIEINSYRPIAKLSSRVFARHGNEVLLCKTQNCIFCFVRKFKSEAQSFIAVFFRFVKFSDTFSAYSS